MPSIAVMARWLLVISAFVGCMALLLYTQLSSFETHASMIASWLQHDQPEHVSAETTETVRSHAWKPLYHLGGNSPWIQKVDGVVDTDCNTPPGCRVDQVHMVGAQYDRVQVGIHLTSVFPFYSCPDMLNAIPPSKQASVGRPALKCGLAS